MITTLLACDYNVFPSFGNSSYMLLHAFRDSSVMYGYGVIGKPFGHDSSALLLLFMPDTYHNFK